MTAAAGSRVLSWQILAVNGRRIVARCVACGARRVLSSDTICACSCQPRPRAELDRDRDLARLWRRRDRSWEPQR